MTGPLLSVKQVAARCGLSEWAVRRAITEGQLEASKLRGRIRVSEQALAAWVADARIKPAGRSAIARPSRLPARPKAVSLPWR